MKARKSGHQLRVAIVDDEEAIRASLSEILSTYGMDTLEIESGKQLVVQLGKTSPDCILLDLRMPDMDGVATLRVINSMPAAPPTIMMSAHGDISAAVEAMKQGATDFIEKPFDDEALAKKIVSTVETSRRQMPDRARLRSLSNRELEIARLVAKGYSSQAIALELGLSVRTVDHHRARILAKMEATSLPQLLSRLVAAGLDRS